MCWNLRTQNNTAYQKVQKETFWREFPLKFHIKDVVISIHRHWEFLFTIVHGLAWILQKDADRLHSSFLKEMKFQSMKIENKAFCRKDFPNILALDIILNFMNEDATIESFHGNAGNHAKWSKFTIINTACFPSYVWAKKKTSIWL